MYCFYRRKIDSYESKFLSTVSWNIAGKLLIINWKRLLKNIYISNISLILPKQPQF